jgi:hypothetical protein
MAFPLVKAGLVNWKSGVETEPMGSDDFAAHPASKIKLNSNKARYIVTAR